MEKERDGEAKLQGLVLAQGLQRCCWESPVSPVAGWGLWDAQKQRTHLGSPKGCFPVGLLVSHHGKAPSSHAARGKGAVKLSFSPVKSSWTLPSTGRESWGCYGCGARPSDPCVGTHIKDQGHMSIIKPGDIRVDVLGISKVKQQGGRWRGVRMVGEKNKIK